MAALGQILSLFGAIARKLRDVCARHKALGARARHHHHPNLVVGVQRHHLLVQRLDCGRIQRVERFWAVNS